MTKCDKMHKPTTYEVIFWNKTGTEAIKKEYYPMYLYSFDDVIDILKGKECCCDIYESRYWKHIGRYVTVGKTFIWDGFTWTEQL